MSMSKSYRALVDLRYPAGPEEYKKAIAGKPYEEVKVKSGHMLTNVSDASIKALLSMGRPVIEEAQASFDRREDRAVSHG